MTALEWRYAAVAAIATTAGAVLKSATDLLSRRRLNSGTVQTSDADDLWATLTHQLARMDTRIDKVETLNQDLQIINTGLIETNAKLATANTVLIDELDALRVKNEALERTVVDLLARLDERKGPVRLADQTKGGAG